jgi:hypothetical protein
LKKIAKEKILFNLGLKIHAICFFAVNAFLGILNYLVDGFETIWFFYPLFGWLVGIGVHAMCYLIYSRGIIGGGKISVLIHGVAFALGAMALIAFNFASVYSGSYEMWFHWPVGFWLLGFLIHAIVIKLAGKKPAKTGEEKSWLEKQVDQELKKAGKKRGGS